MNEPILSKRKANKTKNEAEILITAIQLFKEKGDEQTSIRDIVQATSLARGTFYNYFKNKGEIWDKIIDDLMEKLHRSAFKKRSESKTVKQFMHDSFYPILTILNSSTYRDLIANNSASFRDAFFRHPEIENIISIFERDMRESSLFKELPDHFYKMTVYAMLGSTLEILIQSYLRNDNYSVNEITDFITHTFEKSANLK